MEKILITFLTLLVIIQIYPDELWRLVSWEDFRTLDLIFSCATAVGVFLAWRQFQKNQERQKEIDESSVCVSIPSDQDGNQGVFSVVNYGEVSHQISVSRTTLNDGKKDNLTYENCHYDFEELFSGLIKPNQSIDMHLFDLIIEKTYQYKGLIKIEIDKKIINYLKVRYVGNEAAGKVNVYPQLHPTHKWVIYSQYQKSCKNGLNKV